MIIIGVIILFILICVIVSKVLQNIRNKAAHMVLDNVDFEKDHDIILDDHSDFIIDKNRCLECGNVLKKERLYAGKKEYRGHESKYYVGILQCVTYPNCKFRRRIY
jgi:hypothetical protein